MDPPGAHRKSYPAIGGTSAFEDACQEVWEAAGRGLSSLVAKRPHRKRRRRPVRWPVLNKLGPGSAWQGSARQGSARHGWARRGETVSLWDPVPIGIDERGEVVSIPLAERNILIGGLPGAGKSVLLSMICAAGALDPTCRLWLIDAKKVELAVWRHCAEAFIGPDVYAATILLERLRDEMDRRYDVLLAHDPPLRKVSRDAGLGLDLLVVDEVGEFTDSGDRKTSAAFSSVLRSIVSRGRAAGLIAAVATQKASDRTVPSEVRDLFGYRAALRCSTPQMSDVALGQGWAARGYDAARIADGEVGAGYLLAEEGTPRKIQTFYLSDDDLAALARRAISAREPVLHQM